MIAGIASVLGKCIGSLLYVLQATSLIGKVYKKVWPNSKSNSYCPFAKMSQAAHVPFALPTADRYLVLIRSKQQIDELDRINEHHVSFHTAMADVSLDCLSSTSFELTS